MEIRLVSDLHLESHKDYILEKSENEDNQILILAGDICPYICENTLTTFLSNVCFRFKKVLYVSGNHEYYGSDISNADKKFSSLFKKFENLHKFSPEFVSITIDDVTFIGNTLWTDFDKGNPIIMSSIFKDLSDYAVILNNGLLLRPDYIYHQHKEQLSAIKEQLIVHKQENKVVVITHHSPSYQSMHEKFRTSELNPLFHSDLDDFILQYKPDFWCHGHTHCSFDYHIGDTRVLCNPKGYHSPHFPMGENGEYEPLKTFTI